MISPDDSAKLFNPRLCKIDLVICMKVELEIPKELESGVKSLNSEEIKLLLNKALKERLSERLMFKLADDILKKSEITDELALEWGREIKSKG